jgi:1-acyl-sn-glycerol-3-phosphate acyltransferase
LRLSTHLAQGVLTAAVILPRLSAVAREERIRAWCSQVLHLLGVEVRVRGAAPQPDAHGTMFVANHISWLDIWVLKHLHPMRLISKAEVRAWPVIGWLAEQSGTLFIEREKRHDAGRMMSSAETALKAGDCLCFFPEGTTTDGTELKPFKPSLFQAAINAGAEIRPITLHYPDEDGGTNTAVAYCGDITMLQSLLAVLSLRRVVVEIAYAEPIPAAHEERRHLAVQARQAIASELPLPVRTAPGISGDLPVEVR